MLMPKRVKRRKQFRGSMAGKASRGNTLAYGEFGLVATEPCWIKSNQIEAARIALTRYTKRTGKVWIKIFPDKPVTVKPLGTRMGSGKGAVDCWVAVVKPGRVMFEIAGVPEEDAREALRLAMHKLPIKCKIAKKEEVGLVSSPVGMPGRAFQNAFVQKTKKEKVPIKKCYQCLTPCNLKTTPYCISRALIEAVKGNLPIFSS